MGRPDLADDVAIAGNAARIHLMTARAEAVKILPGFFLDSPTRVPSLRNCQPTDRVAPVPAHKVHDYTVRSADVVSCDAM